ncbi:hypothetical protein ACWO4B_003443, partial [Clostridium sporogenes]
MINESWRYEMKNYDKDFSTKNDCLNHNNKNRYPCKLLKELQYIQCILKCVLNNPTFGLAEIKTEVAAIETAVLSPTFGLAEIKSEVAAIENA